MRHQVAADPQVARSSVQRWRANERKIHNRIRISTELGLTRVLDRERGAWAELIREQPVQNAAGVDNGLAGDRAPGGAVQLDRSFVNIERAAEQVRRAAGKLQSVRAELGPIARSAHDAV